MKSLKNILIGIGWGIIACVVLDFFFKCGGKDIVETTRVVIQIDTIRIEKPVEVHDTIVRWEKVAIVERDTITQDSIVFVKDSTIYIPMEEKVFMDSTFKCVVSGYHPELEWIEVYNKTTTITKEVKKKSLFNVGLQGGYGITPKGLQPYLGLGFQFNF